MKKILSLLFCLALAGISLAQEVVPEREYVNGSPLWGFYNKRTDRWVVRPKYKKIVYCQDYNSYEGTYYYIVQVDNNLFGIVSSKNFEVCVPPIFTDIEMPYMFSTVPLVSVKKSSDWGVLEVGTGENYYLIKPQYQSVSWPVGNNLRLIGWDNQQTWYSMADLVSKYKATEKKVKEEAEQKKEAERQRLAEEAAQRAREAKEKELASFTLYAKNYITPRIEEWQQKGEFEKMADYQARVTGSVRQAKIDELSRQAEELFIQEHIALEPLRQLTLQTYDSENEVFAITSKFGELIVPVPIGEGQAFKQHFATLEKKNVRYYIHNDKLDLQQMDFYDPSTQRSYHYTNNNALNYSQYIINPDALGLPTLNIKTGKTESSMSVQKPMVHILSPSQDNMQYETTEVIFRIDVTAGAGTLPQLYVQIAGGEPQLLTPLAEPTVNKKGAAVVKGKNYAINLPTRNVGENCYVAFFAKDEQGIASETQTCAMRYTGIKSKPNLHLLAVGVSDYQSSSLSRLSYSARDAEDFIHTLENSNLSDYQSLKSKVLLTNTAATERGIKNALRQLTENAVQGDVVMLFFSGHGVIIDGDTYFMGVDSESNDPYSAVDFNDIKKMLRRMSDRGVKVVLFMDACHSGAMAKKGARSLATIDAAGVIGFYSSTEMEESMETQKLQNGLFTHALLQGLKGAAAEKGEITTTSLQHYIVKIVGEESKGQQHPIVENHEGDIKLFNIRK